LSPPPVNKIEADLYVPEDFAYFAFGGTLHRRDTWDTSSNTFLWVEQAVSSTERTPVASGELQNLPPISGINDSFAAIGKQFRFQTLAPRGTISLDYCDRKLFTLLDVLCFIATFVFGWILVRRQRYSALWVCVGLVFVPLCWNWLCTSDFGEIPRSMYSAGLALAAVLLLLKLGTAYRNFRDDRIARAPDPFLEDPVATSATVSPAPEPANAAPTPVESGPPVVADNSGGDAKPHADAEPKSAPDEKKMGGA
jgi:hypothetical protein